MITLSAFVTMLRELGIITPKQAVKAEKIAAMLSKAVTNPVKVESAPSSTDDDDNQPKVQKLAAKLHQSLGRGRVVYVLTKGAKGDALTGNFATAFKAIVKHPGQTKRDYMDRSGLSLKATESAIYGLQQMGLIKSQPIE